MRRIILLSICAVLLSFQVEAKKSIKLFNGRNLDGWSMFTKQIGDNSCDVFKVKDRCIDISGAFGYIYTNEEYSDYKLEVICSGNSVVIYVNGVKRNELTNISVNKGRIGLQSEGKGIQFKDIYLTPLK